MKPLDKSGIFKDSGTIVIYGCLFIGKNNLIAFDLNLIDLAGFYHVEEGAVIYLFDLFFGKPRQKQRVYEQQHRHCNYII